VIDPAIVDLCRLAVRAPDRQFEIAVPTDVPLAELLPTFVSYAGRSGEDLNEIGIDHDGWVLQRLGADPLDEAATVAALDLHDGDTVYLRPRREQLPPVHFDDLVDGVATGLRDRADAWRPAYTHRLLIGLSVVALGAGFLTLLAGGTALERSAAAAAVAILALLGATAASRALGDAAAGSALGAAAVPFLAYAGALVPAGTPGHALTGARLLAGGAAGAAGAALALAGVAASAPLLLAIGVLAVLSAAGGAVMLLGGVAPAGAAGVVAGIAVALGAFVPVLSFRLSGLRLPPLPGDAGQLQEGIDPHPSRDVLTRTRIADHYMTALYAASGVTCVAALTALAGGRGWAPAALGWVLSVLLLLHGRGLAGGWQRLSVVLPGAYGAVLLPLAATWHAALPVRLGVLLAFAVVAAVLVICGWSMPGRRALPYWGRAADVAQSAGAIAMIPLILVVLGVFQALRGAGG
jgi:type VII secretion integral membrane protein EccD